MLLEKILTTRIEFIDSYEFLTNNIDKIILIKLKEKYENKCFKSCFILSIDNIINRSLIRMSETKIDGSCYVNVRFKVTCIIYSPGEIIFGVQITKDKTTDGSLLGISKYASINIMPDNILINFVKEQYIPCIVDRAKYGLFKSISILANSFRPREKNKMFYIVNDKDNKDEKFSISDSLNRTINNMETKIDNIKTNKNISNNFEIFSKLLYIFKEEKKFNLEKYKFDIIPLTDKEINKKKNGIFIRPSELKQENIECYYHELNTELLDLITLKYNYAFVTLSKMYEFLISDYLIFISSLCDMIEYFSSSGMKDPKYTEALKIYRDNKL